MIKNWWFVVVIPFIFYLGIVVGKLPTGKGWPYVIVGGLAIGVLTSLIGTKKDLDKKVN